MSEIESRVDAKLVDLSRREIAMADAEAKPATGAPLSLGETLQALCSLATNPSGPTPKLPGVEITSGRVNHLMGRIPAASAALTGADVFGSEIQTVEVGDIQPQGRRARRLLSLCRQAAPAFGSQSFPIMTSAPASGMIQDGGAPLAITDAVFSNPSPVATPHQGQTRTSFSLQSLIQGGSQFREMVDSSLAVALADLMAGQLVAGDGLTPSLTGLLTIAGTGSTSYLPTNRGGAESFRAAEDALDNITYGPEGRLVFLVATSLFREARKTLREPGTGSYVVEDGRVLGRNTGAEERRPGAEPGDFIRPQLHRARGVGRDGYHNRPGHHSGRRQDQSDDVLRRGPVATPEHHHHGSGIAVMTQEWKRTRDKQRRRRVLDDGRIAIAARQLDGSFGVRVERKLILSGHLTIAEAMTAFDILAVVPATDAPKRSARITERPCADASGHWWAIPPPAKGRDGETEGVCRYCGLTRAMLNVEGPASWRTVRVTR